MHPYPHHYTVQATATADCFLLSFRGVARAAKAMERAEHVCLISNSLVAERRLVATVSVG